MKRTLHLRYNGFSCRVDASDTGLLDWLAEFLTPMFQQQQALHAPDVHLEVTRPNTACQRWQPDERVQQYDGFTCDGYFRRLVGRPTVGGGLLLYDRRNAMVYRASADRKSIRIEPQSGDPRLTRRAVMRVVRELATSHQLQQDCLPMHCSAFAFEEGATLLCGPKRSGKTTLLLYALRHGAAFLANDRAFVDLDDHEPRVHGMPTLIKIRAESLTFFPEHRALARAAAYDSSRTLAELRQPSPKRTEAASISAAQLCQLMAVQPRAVSRIQSLVFPAIDPGVEGLVFQRLTVEQATRALQQSVLRPGPCLRGSQVFAPANRVPRISAAEEHRLRLALASRIPAFACRVGRNAYVGRPSTCPWQESPRPAAAA